MMKRHFNGTFYSPFLVDYWPFPKGEDSSLCKMVPSSFKPLHRQLNDESTFPLRKTRFPIHFPSKVCLLVRRQKIYTAKRCRSSKLMLGILAGKAPRLRARRGAERLPPPRSKPPLNCQIPWKEGRAGTIVAVRLQPVIFKHSVRRVQD